MLEWEYSPGEELEDLDDLAGDMVLLADEELELDEDEHDDLFFPFLLNDGSLKKVKGDLDLLTGRGNRGGLPLAFLLDVGWWLQVQVLLKEWFSAGGQDCFLSGGRGGGTPDVAALVMRKAGEL